MTLKLYEVSRMERNRTCREEELGCLLTMNSHWARKKGRKIKHCKVKVGKDQQTEDLTKSIKLLAWED